MTPDSEAPPEPTFTRTIGPAMLALILLAYPWLAPGLQTRFVFGVPLVIVYLFAVWAFLIALVAAMRTDA